MSYKVFVVAGDNATLQSLSSITAADIDIHMLESSNEAMWELQNNAPAVIIADLNLQGFSGLDLADLVPNFAPDTQVMIHAPNPTSRLEAKAARHGVHRLLAGRHTPEQVRDALYTLLNYTPTAPETADQAPVPAPEPSPPSAVLAPAPEPEPSPPSAPSQRQTRSAPPVEPDEPAAVETAESGRSVRRKASSGGALVVTQETIAPIRAKLQDLNLQLGAQATVITDKWGVTVVEEGRTTLPLQPFLPLIATSFSTMIDYTRQMHQDEGGGLYMHEGTRYDIYIFNVGQQFLLMMIFNKEIASSRLGSVWLYAKRAVRELAEELEGE